MTIRDFRKSRNRKEEDQINKMINASWEELNYTVRKKFQIQNKSFENGKKIAGRLA